MVYLLLRRNEDAVLLVLRIMGSKERGEARATTAQRLSNKKVE